MLMEGIFASIPTPYYPDERIYLRKLEANQARLSRSQIAGMVVLGSTGEASMLTDAETAEVLRVAAEATAPEKALIAGVGRESVRATLELAEVAASNHYDAILVRPPSYYASLCSPEALKHYYYSVADRSPLPLIVYHVPHCIPVEMSVELIAELAQHPKIIAVKDSSGQIDRIRALVEATQNAPRRTVPMTKNLAAVTARMLAPKLATGSDFVAASDLTASTVAARTKEIGFQILCGTASIFLEALMAGATGGVLAFASIAPEVTQEIYLSWKQHDQKLAEEHQRHVTPANRRIVGELGIGALKYACDFNGYYGGYPRSPLLAPTAEQKKEIENLLTEIRN
jgi:4-hydroxy-2-oxoglutarate aldolase